MKKHAFVPRPSGISCLAAALLSASSAVYVALAEETPPSDANTETVQSAPAPDQTSEQGAITAPRVAYEEGRIVAEGTAETPVIYKSGAVTVTAQKVVLDTNAQTLSATGEVVVTREVQATITRLTPRRLRETHDTESRLETLRGDHFYYDYKQQLGSLDNVHLTLVNFTIDAEKITINGQRYQAHNVVVRPGGLTAEELKIYGTPPLNLRAKTLTLDSGKLAPAGQSADKPEDAQPRHRMSLSAKGAALYFHNTKIMPVPNYVLQNSGIGGTREKRAFSITPRISAGSADGVLVTTQLQYAFNPQKPEALLAVADIGLSARQGFRGGASLRTSQKWGEVTTSAYINDIVSNQLNNRVRLNRLPEITYRTPGIGLFNLPGERKAGLILGASWGDYREHSIDSGREVSSARQQAYATLTTRLANPRGPYAEVYARRANYSKFDRNLSTVGFEVGYYGNISRYIDGQFSYSYTKVSGATPFIFDNVEIRRELRTTFDLLLTPRYIIPIDLRYDLDERRMREKSVGILRNYKTFAYGLTYSTSRRQLSLEFRQGF